MKRQRFGCVGALVTFVLCAGCVEPRTEAVVIVSADGIEVPKDIDVLHLVVADRPLGIRDARLDDVLYDQMLRLCSGATTDNCYRLPLSITLVPGPKQPDDSVRVLLQAQKAGTPVISDAALFTFFRQHSLRVDMVLYDRCLGSLACAEADQSCGVDSNCHELQPTMLATADLAIAADAVVPSDLSGFDLTPNDCDGDCNAACGSCGAFEYCAETVKECLPCGAQGDFCCPGTVPCKFGLVCDPTDRCGAPAPGMEKPCGGETQACCLPGSTCGPGLSCNGVQCQRPPADLLMTPADMLQPPMDMLQPPMDMLQPPPDMSFGIDGFSVADLL
jgi:hypothetical protein